MGNTVLFKRPKHFAQWIAVTVYEVAATGMLIFNIQTSHGEAWRLGFNHRYGFVPFTAGLLGVAAAEGGRCVASFRLMNGGSVQSPSLRSDSGIDVWRIDSPIASAANEGGGIDFRHLSKKQISRLFQLLGDGARGMTDAAVAGVLSYAMAANKDIYSIPAFIAVFGASSLRGLFILIGKLCINEENIHAPLIGDLEQVAAHKKSKTIAAANGAFHLIKFGCVAAGLLTDCDPLLWAAAAELIITIIARIAGCFNSDFDPDAASINSP